MLKNSKHSVWSVFRSSRFLCVLALLAVNMTCGTNSDVKPDEKNVESYITESFLQEQEQDQSRDILFMRRLCRSINKYIADVFVRLNGDIQEEQKEIVTQFKVRILDAINDKLGEITTIATLINILAGAQAFLHEKDAIINENSRLHADLIRLLLIKSSPVFMRAMQKEIITILDLTAPRISYWVEQEHHTFYYFMHKSPYKWFFSEKQSDEIARHLKELRKIQECYYQLFGKISRHIENFQMIQETERTLSNRWLGDLLSLGQSVITHQERLLKNKDIDHSIQSFISLAKKLSTCRKTRKIPGGSDSYLARNWIGYGIAGAITTLGLWLVYKYPDRIEKSINGVHEKAEKYVKRQKEILLEVRNTLLWPDKKENDAQKLPGQEMLRNEFERSVDDALAENEENGILKKLIEEKVISSREDCRQQIIEKRNEALLLKIALEANKLDKNQILHINVGSLRDIMFGTSSAANIEANKAVFTAFKALILYYYEYGRREANDIVMKSNNIIKQLSVVIGLLGTGVGLITLYLVYRLVGSLIKIRPHDFRLVREALLDVDRILNLYDRTDRGSVDGSAIAVADWGRLLYSLYNINKEAWYVKEPDRWHFERDVQQLALASSLDVRQRRELIQIMYKQYEFLQDQHEQHY